MNKIILMNTEQKYFDRFADGSSFFSKYTNICITHLPKKEFDHGKTRRQGVEKSDAPFFVLMTQDAMPRDKYLLERLTAPLESEDVAAAYARQMAAKGCNVIERYTRQFNYPEEKCVKSREDIGRLGIKTFFCSNVCAAYRRDVYRKLGGFPERAIFNEDMIYAAGAVKAGYAIVYAAEARVIHSHNYTNLMQLRRNFDLGVSQADHPEIFGSVVSEREGKRLVKETWRYLRREKRRRRFPGFCLQCGFKYAGYLLGKHYRRLPRSWILKITTNKEYWNHVFTITS